MLCGFKSAFNFFFSKLHSFSLFGVHGFVCIWAHVCHSTRKTCQRCSLRPPHGFGGSIQVIGLGDRHRCLLNRLTGLPKNVFRPEDLGMVKGLQLHFPKVNQFFYFNILLCSHMLALACVCAPAPIFFWNISPHTCPSFPVKKR